MFIEVTANLDKARFLVNLDAIQEIFVDADGITQLFLTHADEKSFLVKESYDEVKKLIGDATNPHDIQLVTGVEPEKTF